MIKYTSVASSIHDDNVLLLDQMSSKWDVVLL